MNDEDISRIADLVFQRIKAYIQPDEYISKYSACRELGMGRSNFDRLVAIRKLPKGIKRAGFRELAWRKSDIIQYKLKRREYGRTT